LERYVPNVAHLRVYEWRSKAESFRIRKLLVKRIEQGKAEQLDRGLYRQIYR